MKFRSASSRACWVLAAALASACLTTPETPPPAAPSAAPPAAQPPPEQAKKTHVEYPFAPTAPPPVAPPAGKGLEVELQKYIVVDQFGYRPKLGKVAVLVDPVKGWNERDEYQPGPDLEVRRWKDASVAFSGKPTVWNQGAVDETAGDKGQWFDFSKLEEPGLYYVYDPKNNVRSHPFEIADDVYVKVLQAATKMFYFNRANVEKKPPHSCVGDRCWSLGVDNMGPQQDKEVRSVTDRDNPETARDLTGGWWDAGDTNKYVTFANDAVHQLLSAYEEHEKAFSDDFGIPESGNKVPDLIDELLIEFDWLKKMQPDDLGGGVLIKMGYAEYGDPVPDQSRLPRFYYPKPCSSAAIAAAGMFAHGSLVFGKFNRYKRYAQDLKTRAEKAWKYYHDHEKSDACDDGTIKSGDADRPLELQGEMAVASAAYLFKLTGKAEYDAYVRDHFKNTRPFKDEMWSVYDQSQGDALLMYAGLAKADKASKKAIVDKKVADAKRADLYQFRPELDLYRAYMRPSSYHWGSNNARASFGNTNYDLVQHALVPEAEQATYRERAAGILHSFHGVNPMQLVYLTNMYAFGGDACADEAYHSWFRDKDPKWDNARTSELGPAPGYVTGGPNKDYCKGDDPKEHACATSPILDQPPEKAYMDSNTSWEPPNPFDKSWQITEPAIYYQASYVRLLSKFVP